MLISKGFVRLVSFRFGMLLASMTPHILLVVVLIQFASSHVENAFTPTVLCSFY